MVIRLISPVGRIASNLNSAHLVHIFKSNVYLVSQVQGVFFEDVTVGIDCSSDVGVPNLVLNIKDISACALGDRDCCVSQIVKPEVSEP